MRVLVTCVCGKQFETYEHRIKDGRGKFCSKKCQYSHAIRPSGLTYDIKVKNKGWFKKGEQKYKPVFSAEIRKKISDSNKGKHHSPDTEFKKGQNKGESNKKWVGDKVGYGGLHTWIVRTLGKATICSICGDTTRIQWSNISREYKRDIKDWQQLCLICHRKYDGITKIDYSELDTLRQKEDRQQDIAKKYNVNQSSVSRALKKLRERNILCQ